MAGEHQKLHVVFLPYLAPSHMIPLVDMARLFARAPDLNVTILTTPHNALLFQKSIDQDIKSGHQIWVREISFPSAEVGLPEGIENFNSVTSSDMSGKVFQGIMLLQKPMEQLIRSLSPDCIFSDMFFPWTADLADELKIPRLLFYVSGIFYHCVSHSLNLYTPHDKVMSETEIFSVPNLPDNIDMKRCQLQEHVKSKTRYGDMINTIKQSELKSYGLVHQTFYELEPAYVDHYKKVTQTKLWHIGPLFQFFKGEKDAPQISPEPQHGCLKWLETQKPNSVIYACFGSMVTFSEDQLGEIALALQSCNHPFLWVVREETQENWLPTGWFEEGNKGMLIQGWAPQVKILDHPAIGGFMSHCGWNSVLETIVAGVPLVTWPLYAEHFYNEKLVVLLGIGVRVGAEMWNSGTDIKSPLIGKETIEKAITRLMDSSDESMHIRRKAKELALIAKGVVEEGGSSSNQVKDLIQELKACKLEKATKFE